MKTKVSNLLLKGSVFLIAVVSAFAFRPVSDDTLALEEGYIYKDNVCERKGSCSNTGTQICTHNFVNVNKLQNGSCLIPLKGIWME